MEKSLIEITYLAAEKLALARLENNIEDELEFRVDVIGGATSGFAYDLFFDAPQPDDTVAHSQGIRILLRPDSLSYLTGTVVDWVEGDNGAGFILNNPNEPAK